MIRRATAVLALALLAACAPEKAAETVDKGFATACAADTAGIRSAQEAYRATQDDGSYATMDQLATGFLHEASTLHRVTDVVAPDPANNIKASYKLRVADKRCGSTTDAGDANLVDDAHPDNR